MRVNDEVKQAIAEGKPVVALESTIITHGMPYPTNVETAFAVEEEVRRSGAIPATIGVIAGEIIVGLSKEEIEHLGHSKNVMKLSSRELPLSVVKKANGGTTVSATSFVAEIAGIKVFATGGIGGVHRGAETTFDISRDLEEMSLRNIIIVSAGAKSILDIPKTIEYLETNGVLILGVGTDEFPSFYSRKSGVRIPRVESEREVAQIFKEKTSLGLPGSILVANPIPESDEIPYSTVEVWIDEALSDLNANKISGKAVTPYLLSRLSEKSEGMTLASNVNLVKNNARVAALIAKNL
ncbi:MAG: pseudouridine-5'-phosphate glycosidase [Caldisericaceae bacterium]